MYDVIVIGAGVSGTAIARELSRYECRVCVLEKEADVCCGTSKANSGIVHAGFDAKHGTLKAKLNVDGNEKMEKLAEELDIPFYRNGSLVVCTDRKELPKLEALLDNGIKNKVPGLEILSKDQVKAMEKNISDHVSAALWAPTGGIICPFELNLALAENAYDNKVEFAFRTEVKQIHVRKKEEKTFYEIETANGRYETVTVVNAAGVYADDIHHMVSDKPLDITPRRGEYLLLDKQAGDHVSHTIFDLPGVLGKGVLVTPTIHGNLLVGPTAENVESKEGINTTKEGLESIRIQCKKTVNDIPMDHVITAFSGLRAIEDGHDFVIEEIRPGFIDCAGIASPGLSSCPAIGELAAGMIRDIMGLERKKNFISRRKGIEKNRCRGTIVCRCEMVTEEEIREAARRFPKASTLDGIKRRVRAGMGRCQGGFCSPRVMEILSEEFGFNMLQITKSGEFSNMLTGKNKDGFRR